MQHPVHIMYIHSYCNIDNLLESRFSVRGTGRPTALKTSACKKSEINYSCSRRFDFFVLISSWPDKSLVYSLYDMYFFYCTTCAKSIFCIIFIAVHFEISNLVDHIMLKWKQNLYILFKKNCKKSLVPEPLERKASNSVRMCLKKWLYSDP